MRHPKRILVLSSLEYRQMLYGMIHFHNKLIQQGRYTDTVDGQFRKSVAEVFDDFVLSQMAQGLSDITIATYRHHIHSISNHLDIQKPMEVLTRKDLEAMIVSMRASGVAHNSISSYCRVLRTFSNWCRRGGLSIPELPKIKDKETVKEAYLSIR